MRRRLFLGLIFASSIVLATTGVADAVTLHPSISAAPNDLEALFHDGCLGFETATKPPYCTFGHQHGTYTVALVGDSHASMLFPALAAIAAESTHRNWRLIPLVKIDCPFIDMKIRSAHAVNGVHPYYPSCETWNANVVRRLKSLKPDLVFTIIFKGIFPLHASDDTPAKTGAAVGRMLAKVPGQKVIMVDTPYSYRNVPDCLRSHTISSCAIPRYQVNSDGVGSREKAAAAVAPDSTVLNMTNQICGGQGWVACRVVTGDLLMFRDNHHFTATYAKWFGPNLLDPALEPLLH